MSGFTCRDQRVFRFSPWNLTEWHYNILVLQLPSWMLFRSKIIRCLLLRIQLLDGSNSMTMLWDDVLGVLSSYQISRVATMWRPVATWHFVSVCVWTPRWWFASSSRFVTQHAMLEQLPKPPRWFWRMESASIRKGTCHENGRIAYTFRIISTHGHWVGIGRLRQHWESALASNSLGLHRLSFQDIDILWCTG